MQHPRRFLPVIGLVILAGLGLWYFGRARSTLANGSLKASGTVEAVEVSIGAEAAGRVAEVLVGEGEPVKAGQPLFRLDDELLQSQRQQAAAALQAAQDGLATAQAGLEASQANLKAAEASAASASANAEAELVPLRQSLRDLNDNTDVTRAAAETAIAKASRAVRESTYLLDNFTIPNNQQKLTAQQGIDQMKERLDQARARFEPYKNESSGNSIREKYKEALDEAQSDYDAAVRRMEYETAVAQAQAALDLALRDLDALKNGPDPDQVAVLEARIAALEAAPKQAQAAVGQAKAGLAQAQTLLDQAQSMVEQAKAQLNLVELQIVKLTVYAPVSGMVLTRSIEPGEVVQPGATALSLGQLDQLTITVYLPEDRYGAIKLGMKARVEVDSFPGKTFEATVKRIANQAEYTPRNVQTDEGRKTTVFAIELAVQDGESQLKPGMPADVTFQN